jgi:DNA-binding GntR family transcriptional regulator
MQPIGEGTMTSDATTVTQNGRTPPAVDEDFRRVAAPGQRLPAARSNSQRAYDLILRGILTGLLPSGKRLPEIPLATALGLGRTPVREALMRLEGDGFVQSEPRVGMVVAGNTLESLAEIYEVREVLEGFAARLAARYHRPSDLVALRSILTEMEGATEQNDVSRLRPLNVRFHEQIHRAARNDQLRRVLQRLLNLVRLSPVSAYAAPGRPAEALAEHRAIVGAIEARDEDLAARLASEHKRRDKEARLAQMAAHDGGLSSE